MNAFTKPISILFFVLLLSPAFAEPPYETVDSVSPSGVTLRVETRTVEAGPELEQTTQYLSTLLVDLFAQTRIGAPIVEVIAANLSSIEQTLARHDRASHLSYTIVRALGGGVTTYFGLTYAGDHNLLTDWFPKLVTSVVCGLVNAGWMYRNDISQTILNWSISRAVGKLAKRTFKGPISWMADRAVNVLASLGIEFTFEYPKQTAAKLLMPAGHFKGSLKGILSVVTLGQGLFEISLAKRTKLKLRKAVSKAQERAIQLMSDSLVLAVSLLTTFSVALEYVSPEGGALFLNTMVYVGITAWLDTMITPFLIPQRRLARATNCGSAIRGDATGSDVMAALTPRRIDRLPE